MKRIYHLMVFGALNLTILSALWAEPSTPVSQLTALLQQDPHTNSNLINLAQRAEALAEMAGAREKEIKAAHKEIRQKTALENLSADDLQKYFHGSPNDLTKREIHGVSAIAEFARAASETSSSEQRDACINNLDEIMVALRNNLRSPVPDHAGFISVVKFASSAGHESFGAGTTPATNLMSSPGDSDLSQSDPVRSTFWARPQNIAAQNLSAGFGRAQCPDFSTVLLIYDGPKTSYGATPGFDARFNGRIYKIKFSEAQSEPFAARIFDALGYHVDPTDFTPRVKIRYDRRIFREFNLRGEMMTRIAGPFNLFPLGYVHLQPRYDPFQYVTTAVLKDGRRLSGLELKKILLVNPRLEHPEDAPENFRAEIEQAIDYLEMRAANVQSKNTPGENIGPWEFDGLGHENLRELRGAGLLAAWLGFCDTRPDNTRLRIESVNGEMQLKHFFTDLGGGMGGAKGTFTIHGENPDKFDWTFTRREIIRGPGQMTTPFQVTQYRPITPTLAFREMTVDDARWMARLIGHLTEQQIHDALTASGYSAAEVTIYCKKLVSRRDQMIADLQLANEISLLHGAKNDHSFPDSAESAVLKP